MKQIESPGDVVSVALAARKVADFASSLGVIVHEIPPRRTCNHLGAVLADSVLQAGLNYRSVVLPRIEKIFADYPTVNTCEALVEIVESGATHEFLNWKHFEKIARFERLVRVIHLDGITDTSCLRNRLVDEDFCLMLTEINGIGPKTVDYMACLVGIESVAVDRHIRSFAKQVGVQETDYHFLKRVFCFAADFLNISRRGFDAWVWQLESSRDKTQLAFDFSQINLAPDTENSVRL